MKTLKNGYLRISKKGLEKSSSKTETLENTFRRVAKINDIKRVILVNKASTRFYYFIVEEDF